MAASRFLNAGTRGKTRKVQRQALSMQLKSLRPADWQRNGLYSWGAGADEQIARLDLLQILARHNATRVRTTSAVQGPCFSVFVVGDQSGRHAFFFPW